jgi:hypothetical protein
MACEQCGSMLASSLAPEAVGMITAYTAMLTPCWQPKSCGHQQTGDMTVQAILVLAFGERSIHDHILAFIRSLLDRCSPSDRRPASRHAEFRGLCRMTGTEPTCDRMPTRVSRKLHDRSEKLSPTIRGIAGRGQIRLYSCYRLLAASGKPKVVVTTAIAHEIVGFIWATARVTQPALEG